MKSGGKIYRVYNIINLQFNKGKRKLIYDMKTTWSQPTEPHNIHLYLLPNQAVKLLKSVLSLIVGV